MRACVPAFFERMQGLACKILFVAKQDLFLENLFLEKRVFFWAKQDLPKTRHTFYTEVTELGPTDYIEVCTDMCLDMCVDTCIDICVDVCIPCA